MDEIVARAMARWPNVPAVYGWLALDARGRWLIKSSPITNPGIVDFIGRNYDRDDAGCWYFQNGPQRVFVELACTPLILRLDGGAASGRLLDHVGRPIARVDHAFVDEAGHLLLATERGPGCVDDRDVESLATGLVDACGRPLTDDALIEVLETLQAGSRAGLFLRWHGASIALEPIASGDLEARLGFVRRPQPVHGEEACT